MKTYKIKNSLFNSDGTIDVPEAIIKALIKDNPDLLKPEVKGRYFFPKVGDMYWAFDRFGVVCKTQYVSGDVDIHRISIGNCYRTQEEAELALKKQQAIVRCWKWQQENAPFEPDWGDLKQYKYFVYYDVTGKKLHYGVSIYGEYQSTLPYFKSLEDRDTFIQANKEDLLLLFTK